MSKAVLIPHSFWFRPTLECHKSDAIPRPQGRPLNLTSRHALPDLGSLNGQRAFAHLRVAWNAEGLGIAVEVSGKSQPIQTDPYAIGGRDEVELWIDTRDTRDVHRATKFCHHFLTHFRGAKPGSSLEVDVEQRRLHRALADAPTARSELVRTWAEPTRHGYRLEVFFPAVTLHGFDPDTNRRLGLYYRVGDPEQGDQFLSVGREFPVGEDPSLWATLELLGD